MNLSYIIPRIVRHFLPEKLVRALLLRGWVIQPGLETSDPKAAVQRYHDVLFEKEFSLEGKRVLVFGYGGRFDIGVGFLRAGATHVVLCDKFAPPDEIHNWQLFSMEPRYFSLTTNQTRPRPEWMTLSQTDIRDVGIRGEFEPVDVVVSNSVYEHLDDVEGITRALAALTNPNGLQVHFVDLRDHFFKYPFEMLRFSDKVWYQWLNPSSNHNRYRLWNYRRAFGAFFNNVEIQILSRDKAAFLQIRPFILPKFLNGNIEEENVTTIRVVATKPI